MPYFSLKRAAPPRVTDPSISRRYGIGDLELDGLITVYRRARWAQPADHRRRGERSDRVHRCEAGQHEARIPMQLGSGTFALPASLTYLGQTERWAWVAETVETIRVGKNGNGYRLGNQYRVDGRIARKLTNWLSVSTQAEGRLWDEHPWGRPRLKISDEPTKDPNAQGGKRVDLPFGVNLYVPQGMLTGHPDYNNKGLRFAIQAGFPVYESLDGPQLGNRLVPQRRGQLHLHVLTMSGAWFGDSGL